MKHLFRYPSNKFKLKLNLQRISFILLLNLLTRFAKIEVFNSRIPPNSNKCIKVGNRRINHARSRDKNLYEPTLIHDFPRDAARRRKFAIFTSHNLEESRKGLISQPHGFYAIFTPGEDAFLSLARTRARIQRAI